MFLYHYFEKSHGPFLNLSDLNNDEAIQIQNDLSARSQIYARRYANGQYIFERRIVEKRAYAMFVRKGGKPQRQIPYYGLLSENELEEGYEWFVDCGVVKIPIDEFDKSTISFTHGDTFPTFSPNVTDGMEYRNTVYTHDEILKMIEKYGMPQDTWDKPVFAQPCYVEAQIWSDEPVMRYKNNWKQK